MPVESARAKREYKKGILNAYRCRRYGKDYGGKYLVELVNTAPRVRVRNSQDRAHKQLVDLAVLNERLAGDKGGGPWEARKRLEYLTTRRLEWEHVYEYITKTDAAATLASIEEAYKKVGGRL